MDKEDVLHIYNGVLAIEKNEILPFVTTWMDFFFFSFFAVLGLRCCVRAFSSCSERGLLFIAVCGLIVVAPLVVGHGL